MADTRHHGDLANQLLLESRRSTQSNTLLKYNDPLVRSLILERRDLERAAESLMEAEPHNVRPPPSQKCWFCYEAMPPCGFRLPFQHIGRISMLPGLSMLRNNSSAIHTKLYAQGIPLRTGNPLRTTALPQVLDT
ncbi:hypothetical protein FA13DRAFT_1741813 [Coprinellus micaceus]|uniref:Uncharacterized protein n=1 Tax=Coprinellus micaceus TaxID=71717 RepID=A0A4Y7SHX4_COPMI|nr:hypothetical protein FA13DRAFT_1741813 [Coprinellus micaceus]